MSPSPPPQPASFLPPNNAARPENTSSPSRSQSPAKRLKSEDPAVVETPTPEQQVLRVKEAIDAPLVEGEPWFVVSLTWLKRFYAQHPDYKSKGAQEGPVGPIDNSDIVAAPEDDAAGLYLLDSSEDQQSTTSTEFTQLSPGTLGEDYEIVPAASWEALVRWYGVSAGSPIIKRFVANTAEPGEAENLQVEIYPTVFSVYRLRDPSSAVSRESLDKEKKQAPKQVVAARTTGFQKFLKKVKVLADVEPGRKVRLWRVLRVPEAEKGKKTGTFEQMVLDVNTFLKLENQTDRELIEIADETMNPNYNGRSKLATVGLGTGGAIVLEEQTSAGGWVTDVVSKTANRFGETVSVAKKGLASKNTPKKELTVTATAASSRSVSPARSLLAKGANYFTRGREKREGRTLGTCGLSNLGNTCYMNSALQCLRAVEELSKYFISGEFEHELNPTNLIGHHGKVAKAYAGLLKSIFAPTSPASLAPREFKNTIGRFGPSFSGYQQQDTQEFLAFLLDGLHEDLNRITQKPYNEKPDSTDEMVGDNEAIAKLAEQHWQIYKARNHSAVADLFAGLYKSTLVCPECQKVSITFDPFMDLTLPLPIESLWSRDVIFFPANKRKGFQGPVKIPVELQKHASMGTLKEYIGKRTGVDPKRIMGAEIYSSKFYRLYDDQNSIGDQIQSNDTAVFYELETEFTNYPPPKTPKKSNSMFTFDSYDDIDEYNQPETSKLLVPVFTRIERNGGKKSYGSSEHQPEPFFIVLDREEQRDYATIMEKLVEKYQVLTTADLYESSQGAEEEPVVSDEDESMEQVKSPPAPKEKTDDEKDGFVDVQVKDAMSVADSDEARPAAPRRRKVPENLASQLDIKVAYKKDGDVIQTAWNSLNADIDLISRLGQPIPVPAVVPSKLSAPMGAGTPESDASDVTDQEMVDIPAHAEPEIDMMNTSSDDETYSTQGTSAFAAVTAPPFYANTNASISGTFAGSPNTAYTDPPGPLVRYGEALVVYWTPGANETVFGGTHHDDIRGRPTWTSHLPTLADPELAAARQRREERRRAGIHLEDCLDEFAKEEILSASDPWYCPRCKEQRRASKKFELWKSPDILVIHLKRFSSSRSFRDKIDVQIQCPVEGLDLTHRVGDAGGKQQIYDLFAVDNHYGGLGGGHYTAYVKNWVDSKWYYCDDASVRHVDNPSNVITPAAYLLFYRRRSDVPLGGPAYEKLLGDEKARVNNLGEQSESSSESGRELEQDEEDEEERVEDVFVGPVLPAYEAKEDVGNSTLWGNSLPVVTMRAEETDEADEDDDGEDGGCAVDVVGVKEVGEEEDEGVDGVDGVDGDGEKVKALEAWDSK